MYRKAKALLILLQVIAFGIDAQSDVTPLFRDEKPLLLRLNFARGKVKKTKEDTLYFSSVLQYRNGQDGWDSLAVGLRARGNFRREHCYFPPLRLKIKKSNVKETLFAGNKSLKLVLPCEDGRRYNDLLMKEYVCYQLYEVVTRYTFHTRLVDITLGDNGGKQVKTYQLRGFFIEDDDLAAKRLGGKVVDSINLHPLSLMDTFSLRHDFFEYMIANTDWSSTFYHNIKIIMMGPRKYVPIAYDFDMAGFVNAPYASVSEQLGLANVRQRLYRGFCRKEAVTQFVRNEFIQLEPTILQVIERQGGYFEPKDLAGMKKYTEEFFSILKNDTQFKENILEKCRTR